MNLTDTKKCLYCAELINIDARKCKHCGEFLDGSSRSEPKVTQTFVLPEQKIRRWSPGVAALLSFLIPGAGQMYKGNVGSGLVWLFVVVIGYVLLIVPGLILHLICIFAAASGNPYKD